MNHDVVWTPEKVAATWDYFGTTSGHSSHYFSAHSGSRIVRRLDRELALKDKRVLDYGCGRGDLLAELYKRGIPAAGQEFSLDSLQETASRFAQEPLFRGVHLSEQLEPASFDVVLLVEVIEHLLDEQLAPTIADVRRLLAPGGRVAVTCPNGEDLSASSVRCPDCGATFHMWQHMRRFTPESISQLFEQNGFKTELAVGTWWSLTPLVGLRSRLRHPGTPLPQPHLLYVGSVR